MQGVGADGNPAQTLDAQGNSLMMWAARVGNIRAMRCVTRLAVAAPGMQPRCLGHGQRERETRAHAMPPRPVPSRPDSGPTFHPRQHVEGQGLRCQPRQQGRPERIALGVRGPGALVATIVFEAVRYHPPVNAVIPRSLTAGLPNCCPFPPLLCPGSRVQENLEVVSTLLSFQANMDTADAEGSTALAYAARAGSANTAAKLLDAHADMNTVDDDEKSPLTVAARCVCVCVYNGVMGMGRWPLVFRLVCLI